MRATLSTVALVVLVLGSFVVQCRTPNGGLATRFLFTACSPEVGCCDLPEESSIAHGVNGDSDSGTMACDDGCAGGCSESALFFFVGTRGSRDDGRLAVPAPYVLAELHPASDLAAVLADGCLIHPAFACSIPAPQVTSRVLRI
jgi:hypothetical protein